MRLRHEATYQGYAGVEVQYRRSQGLGPEPGYIDLDMRDVKKLRVIPRDVPWRAINGSEVPGQLDIKTYFGLFSDQTVTAQPELPRPQGGGLNPFGNLVLSTYNDLNGGLVSRVVYTDVYVAPGGLEEITPGLAKIEGHDVGIVRVPLTDIRAWWGEGALFCKINRRTKSGNWDRTSLDGDVPWSLVKVLRFLASQLPGSPSVVSYSDVIARAGDFDPPTNVIGEGEPVREHLQLVLDHYGLTAGLLPTNNLVISRKYSKKHAYKQVGGPGGAAENVPTGGQGLHYERKTSAQTGRPAAVVVCGPRRVQRMTAAYVPVLQYVDGRYYPLETVLGFMGYPRDFLDGSLLNRSDRRFSNVPPQPGDGNNGRLHEKHREILATAYKVYAPAFLFPASGGTGSYLPDIEKDLFPFLPLMSAAWYTRELGAGRALEIPADADKGKGDQDDFVLVPPVVRGFRMGTDFFTDWSRIEQYFSAKISADQAGALEVQKLIESKKNRIQALADELSRADTVAGETVNPGDLASKWAAKNAAGSVAIDNDIARAARDGALSGFPGKDQVARKMYGTGWLIEQEIEALQREITILEGPKSYLRQAEENLRTWRARFEQFKTVHAGRGGVAAKYNLPYDVIPHAYAHVDRATGILTSSVPLCQVNKPFFFDGDSVKVVGDGAVTVTFGYELKDANIGAFTAYLFSAQAAGEDEPAKSVFAGVCRASPIKARAVPMNGRMYLLDEGTPVNFNACLAEAYGKAAEVLGVPASTTGYTYEVDGLRDYWLDAGISSVQHVWATASRPGMTYVAVNSPGARLPAGPPLVPTVDLRAPRAERAEGTQRERVN